MTRQKMQRKHSTYKQSKGGGLVGGLVHTGDWDMRDQKETSERQMSGGRGTFKSAVLNRQKAIFCLHFPHSP